MARREVSQTSVPGNLNEPVQEREYHNSGTHKLRLRKMGEAAQMVAILPIFLAFKHISEGGLLLSSWLCWLRFGCFLGCASRGKSIASKLVVALFSIKD